MASCLPIALNGSMSLDIANFGHYRHAPAEVDDLGFLDELAAELDGAFDMGDLLLDDLQLPAAGARAASNALVPPLSLRRYPAPLVLVVTQRSDARVAAPPSIAAPAQREVSRGPFWQLPASCVSLSDID